MWRITSNTALAPLPMNPSPASLGLPTTTLPTNKTVACEYIGLLVHGASLTLLSCSCHVIQLVALDLLHGCEHLGAEDFIADHVPIFKISGPEDAESEEEEEEEEEEEDEDEDEDEDASEDEGMEVAAATEEADSDVEKKDSIARRKKEPEDTSLLGKVSHRPRSLQLRRATDFYISLLSCASSDVTSGRAQQERRCFGRCR